MSNYYYDSPSVGGPSVVCIQWLLACSQSWDHYKLSHTHITWCTSHIYTTTLSTTLAVLYDAWLTVLYHVTELLVLHSSISSHVVLHHLLDLLSCEVGALLTAQGQTTHELVLCYQSTAQLVMVAEELCCPYAMFERGISVNVVIVTTQNLGHCSGTHYVYTVEPV